ncbi:plantaricin C family lantibiotic [Microbispora sp. CA-135349]|uniref:plantaricin C family lantibiotic n=1 Tax=Microbispora sp. CA-135349 TaxID=3239953 RepID=UPI003D9170C5
MKGTTSPNAGILQEIENQDIETARSAGSLTLIECYTVASWVLGNPGAICTLSVECQKSCQH